MADTPEQFVIDACALIAYLNNEVGADKVEQLLKQA
jgi:PIN domain nuclease of toxin-antitoxin system